MLPDEASGTLTFLFTDLEGSTRLWERFPQAMKGALERHDSILLTAVTAVGGQVVKTTAVRCYGVWRREGTPPEAR
jgi:class 3 adenylate cyclase